jgi:hypothetical protein
VKDINALTNYHFLLSNTQRPSTRKTHAKEQAYPFPTLCPFLLPSKVITDIRIADFRYFSMSFHSHPRTLGLHALCLLLPPSKGAAEITPHARCTSTLTKKPPRTALKAFCTKKNEITYASEASIQSQISELHGEFQQTHLDPSLTLFSFLVFRRASLQKTTQSCALISICSYHALSYAN